MNSLHLFIAVFNLWLFFKTSDKIDYLIINYSKNLHLAVANSLNEIEIIQLYKTSKTVNFGVQNEGLKGEFNRMQKHSRFRRGYLIFITGIAISAIGMDFVLFKNAKVLKGRNMLLRTSNKLMLEHHTYLQNTLSKLEQNNEENNRILQVIAHDLRSPMAAIVGLSSFMIDEHNLSEEDMEVISIIHTSGVDSLKFINEILDRETIEIELKKETIDLHLLLTYCITQLQFKADEKKQRIILKGSKTFVKINREKIWRVIANLISNAIKFSPVGSIIMVNLDAFSEKAVIAVRDYGIGIPENLRDKVFGSSTQRKRPGTDGEKSFGIGLAITKQNVEAHGGIIRFESEVGKGTTFFVELPIDEG